MHINNLNQPEQYLWLKALIWPEHKERQAQFEAAARCMRKHDLQLIEGNGVQLLYELALAVPHQYTLCVFHTHVANQLAHDDKVKLDEIIAKLGQKRTLAHLYNNMWDLGHLHLDYYSNGQQFKSSLADTDGHGRLFKWTHF